MQLDNLKQDIINIIKEKTKSYTDTDSKWNFKLRHHDLFSQLKEKYEIKYIIDALAYLEKEKIIEKEITTNGLVYWSLNENFKEKNIEEDIKNTQITYAGIFIYENIYINRNLNIDKVQLDPLYKILVKDENATEGILMSINKKVYKKEGKWVLDKI